MLPNDDDAPPANNNAGSGANDNNAPAPDENAPAPPQRMRIPLDDVRAEIGRAGGGTDPTMKPGWAQNWYLVVSANGRTVEIPSNALENPVRDSHLATFNNDAVQQAMSQLDLMPSRTFSAKWGFAPELPTPDVDFKDLRTAIFQAGAQYVTSRDEKFRLVIRISPPPDSGELTFTSRESSLNEAELTFAPLPVQELFRQLNVEPSPEFVREYPRAVPYEYRPPLGPPPPEAPPDPPAPIRDQIRAEMDGHGAADTDHAMDVLRQAEEQQRALQEQEQRQREEEQRRREQAEEERRRQEEELERQRAEHGAENPGGRR